MTYTQAVELLESYGVKISSECNGVSVIKACAQIVQNQAQQLKKLTEADRTLENATRALKSLRLHAKVLRLEDGDLLWFKSKDLADEQLYGHLRKIVNKLVEPKRVLLVVTDPDDDLSRLDREQRQKLIARLQELDHA